MCQFILTSGRSTWLRVIDEDVQPQNVGVHTAWRKAKDRDTWHQVVNTATLCYEFATKFEKLKSCCPVNSVKALKDGLLLGW